MGDQGACSESFMKAVSPTRTMRIFTNPKAGDTTSTIMSTLLGASMDASIPLKVFPKKGAPVSVSSIMLNFAVDIAAMLAPTPMRMSAAWGAGGGVGVGTGVAVGGTGVAVGSGSSAHAVTAARQAITNKATDNPRTNLITLAPLLRSDNDPEETLHSLHRRDGTTPPNLRQPEGVSSF